jgi:serine protease
MLGLSRQCIALGAFAALVGAGPGAAWAAASPALACQSAQLAAAAKLFSAELKCAASFYKGGAADAGGLTECRLRAQDAFEAAYQDSLDDAGPNVCALREPAAGVTDDLAAETDALVAGISGGFAASGKDESALHGSLQRATGSALSGALGAERKHAKKPDEAKRVAARAKAREKLLASFAKALAKAAGVPYAGLSADAAAAEVDRIADELAAETTPELFAVAGAIQAAAGSIADSDVNDPNVPATPNDSFGQAQAVPVPSALGGYVNQPGEGAKGSSEADGDVLDVFRVSLVAGQRVNLRFANPAEDDLDLYLYSSLGFLVDLSIGTSETEEVVAPSSDDFYVEVQAFAGAASYVLTLGVVGAAAEAAREPLTGAASAQLDDEFVPGELIVTLAPRAAKPGAGPPAAAAAVAASLGLEAHAGDAAREMLFRLPEAAAARASTFAALGAADVHGAWRARLAHLPAEQQAKAETLLALKTLRLRPELASADPNFIRRAQLVPNDDYYPLQWHYPLINLPAAWDVTTGNAAVEVAVIDTGVLFGHPDLQGQLSSAFDYDFVSDPSRSLDGGGIDANAEDPGDGAGVQPSSFHGTHVAGTIGARTDNDTGANNSGVSGIAWDVTIVPLRALGLFGSGTSYDILQAVRYASGQPNDSGTSHLVDVINLSLGGTGSSTAEQSVYTQARNAGVIVVAAAGNNNSSQAFFPASYDGVVSVSAVETRRQKAPYSNFGSNVDVAAPGGDTSVDRNGDGYADGVLSTLRDEGSGSFAYAFYQGTSMASPHVAGVAALMRAVNPAYSPAQLDADLAMGKLTTDLGAAGRDDIFGHGLIDALRAVQAADANAPTDPILLVSTGQLNLGTTLTSASFVVSNGGGGTLTIASVTDDQPWLSVSGSGLGTYTATVDRTGLADGTYTGTITVDAGSEGTATVSVVMAKLASAGSADAGFHYVLLLDPESFETVAQFDAAATAGLYAFDFADVPSGTYLLYAGSDSDNDFFICGTGEACGAYPTLGRPEPIEVTEDLSSLDFVSGFLQTLESAATAGDTPPGPRPRRLRERELAR